MLKNEIHDRIVNAAEMYLKQNAPKTHHIPPKLCDQDRALAAGVARAMEALAEKLEKRLDAIEADMKTVKQWMNEQKYGRDE